MIDLPIYESSLSSLYFPKYGVIRIVPLAYIKSLFRNIHSTIFSINKNFPEFVKSLTCKDATYKHYCQITQGRICVERTSTYPLGSCTQCRLQQFLHPCCLPQQILKLRHHSTYCRPCLLIIVYFHHDSCLHYIPGPL